MSRSLHHAGPTRAALASVLAVALVPAAAHAAASDACALLTPAQVGAALGAPVGAGEPVTPTDHKVCTWRATGGGAYVTLMLQPAEKFDRARQEGNLGGALSVTPVGGLGEGAMYIALGDNVGLVVKKAGVSFKVAVYKHTTLEEKRAAEKALAAQVVARL